MMQRALINRMGFNNLGVEAMVGRLEQRRWTGVVGVNIGKNRDTPLSKAVDDYLHCLGEVYPHADYVTVNLSSPNTPGLRELQFGAVLEALLVALKASQQQLADLSGIPRPTWASLETGSANPCSSMISFGALPVSTIAPNTFFAILPLIVPSSTQKRSSATELAATGNDASSPSVVT